MPALAIMLARLDTDSHTYLDKGECLYFSIYFRRTVRAYLRAEQSSSVTSSGSMPSSSSACLVLV